MAIQKSLSQILKSLENVGKADSVYSVASSDRINAIQDALRLLARGDNIVQGSNVRKTGGDGYTVLSGKSPRIGNVSGKNPFEIEIQTQDTYRVRPGTINDMMPANMFEQFFYDPNSTSYSVLKVLTDSYTPTYATLESRTVPPDPNPHLVNVAPAKFEVMIGVIVNGVPFNTVTYNLNAFPVDIVHTLTPTPEAGRPFYDINYSWAVESV